MLATSNKMRTTPALSLALLLLSVGVFAWGMQYKLSLYQQHSPSHPVSVAKLLSDNQVSKKNVLPHSGNREAPHKLALLAALVLFVPPAVVARDRQAGDVAVSATPSHSYSLFFRP